MNEILAVLKEVGARLKGERKRMSLEQIDFAELGNVKRASQSAYENGRSALGIDYLLNLAEHGVDIGYVLTGTRTDGTQLHNDYEYELIRYIRHLDDDSRDKVMALVKLRYQSDVLEKELLTGPRPANSLDSPSNMLHDQRREFRGKDRKP